MLSRSLFLTSILSLLLSACARDTISSDKIAMGSATSSDISGSGGSSGSGSGGSGDGYKSDNIRRSYSFRYSEGDSRASFLATCYLASTWSTTVKLSSPSQLMVNGSIVQSKELMSKEGAVTAESLFPIFTPFFYLASGTNYFADLAGVGPSSTISVDWTDQGGQVFHDRMTMSSFSFAPPSLVSASRDLQISVYGGEAGAEYSASLSSADPTPGAHRGSASGRSSGQSITFSADELSRLGPGPAKLSVEKRTSASLDLRGGNRGSGSIVYSAAPVSVDVSN
jgi:hypothetical protein